MAPIEALSDSVSRREETPGLASRACSPVLEVEVTVPVNDSLPGSAVSAAMCDGVVVDCAVNVS